MYVRRGPVVVGAHPPDGTRRRRAHTPPRLLPTVFGPAVREEAILAGHE